MSTIIQKGRSDYQILTPRRGGAAEQAAALELQEALFRMTNVRLPVRSVEQRVAEHPAILVGTETDGAQARQWEKDSYQIVPDGGDLVLSGSSHRGTRYAVTAFLESLGARFYWPGSEIFPRLDRVSLPVRPIRSTAAFSYRHVFYPTAQTPQWALRWKLNVHDGKDACWGENARAHSWGHSFAALVPLKDHFERHPEYFSWIDGKRRDRQTQLCCTNPKVAEIACQTMSRWIASNPQQQIFAVGMNDWDGWCECPNCAKVDRREGGPVGQLLTLVNRVAERFPDRLIATLAYAWAIDPPRRMRARDNALIVLCHNEGCYTHALDGCEHNRRFLQRLRGWKRRSRRILIWDYYVNYHSYLMPTPNFRRIARDFRTYRDLGIEAMFCQGSAVRGGQFEGLRQYLQAKLLWNPDQDAWAIAEDWVNGVYGVKAGAHILEYLAMLEDHVERRDVHMPSFGSGQEIQPELFPPHILKRGARLWDKAEQAADDGVKERVIAARAPEMCSRLFNNRMRYEVRGARLMPVPRPDKALASRFARAAMQGGAAHLRENAGTPESFARNYGRTYKAVVLESEHLRAVVVPELGGRIYSLHHKPTGLQLMHMAELTRKVNYLPYGAGYEFSVYPRWQAEGSSEEYRIVEQGTGRVAMEVDLKSALRVATEFVLDGNELQVRHRVENRGRERAKVEPFTHPEWNYKAFGDEAEFYLRRGAKWDRQLLNPQKRPNRDLEFEKDHMPEGAWQVVSAVAPLALQETFRAAAVGRTRLTFGGWGNMNLELYYKPRLLRPGQAIVFQTLWRVAGDRDGLLGHD